MLILTPYRVQAAWVCEIYYKGELIMTKANLLQKVGEKLAMSSIEPMCFPFRMFQPRLPAKLQNEMKKRQN